eukprot:SAG31_NODE_32343_length_357_cov_0.790698_1_plen_74_part_01
MSRLSWDARKIFAKYWRTSREKVIQVLFAKPGDKVVLLLDLDVGSLTLLSGYLIEEPWSLHMDDDRKGCYFLVF